MPGHIPQCAAAAAIFWSSNAITAALSLVTSILSKAIANRFLLTKKILLVCLIFSLLEFGLLVYLPLDGLRSHSDTSNDAIVINSEKSNFVNSIRTYICPKDISALKPDSFDIVIGECVLYSATLITIEILAIAIVILTYFVRRRNFKNAPN